MDILIRDVDALTIAKLNRAAKKEKLSRDKYLKRQIERLTNYDVFVEERMRFEKVAQDMQHTMTHYLEMQQELYEKVIRIESVLYLLLDVDEAEIRRQLALLAGKEAK
ncbi:MAG: hypothetical protein RR548_09815 [Carnobacterium sp.]|uniref:hypothetical protein n=1 Tax=Carnobacterium sp. TaxID=48221 RepID=UPI002FCAC637